MYKRQFTDYVFTDETTKSVMDQSTYILSNPGKMCIRDRDRLVAEKMGYSDVFAVTGQTYPRKLDSQIPVSYTHLDVYKRQKQI